MSSLPEHVEQPEHEEQVERRAAPLAPRPLWDAEHDAATMEEHVRQLLTELQMKRKEASIGSAAADAESGWARGARSALRRAALAERGALCAGAAARRLAAAGEREARRAAEGAPRLEAALHENRLLKARVRDLAAEAGERGWRERSAQAERAAHEAWARPVTAVIERLNIMAAEMQERQKRTESCVIRLEDELEAELAVRAALLEDKSRREAVEQQLRDQLQRAVDHVAEMASMIGALQADRAASDVN